MAKVKIYPGALSGIVNVPSSKKHGAPRNYLRRSGTGHKRYRQYKHVGGYKGNTALFKSAWCTVGTYSKPV